MNKFVIALSLFLVGCQLGGTTPTPGPQFYATGTQGLDVRVNTLSNNQLFMCEEGEVLLDLHNLGTSDIAQGIYTLTIEDQILKPVGKTKKQGSYSLEGRSAVNPVGGYTQLGFRFKTNNLPAQLETYQTPFIFNACYPYATSANIPVCIDPTRDPQAARSCKTTPVSGKGGQGAPVLVTLVEPLMVVQDNAVLPTFIVHIANAGKGRVVSTDSLGFACGNGGGTPSSKVRVMAQLQDEQLKCLPEMVDLRQGETKVTCMSNTYFGAAEGRANQGTFTTPLTVQLEYGYVTTLFYPFTITRLAHQEDCSSTQETYTPSTVSTSTDRGINWPPKS